MSESTLPERLADWLETSGRALELRTARAFRAHPAVRRAEQSVAYEDVNSKHQREGDVLAVYHWLTGNLAVSLEVAAECKGAVDRPWVAFYDHRRFTPLEARAWFQTVGAWPAEHQAELISEWHQSNVLLTDRVATHAVSAFGKDSKNDVHDAARQALSFAMARAKNTTRYTGDPADAEPMTAVMPTVVTRAPLFTCELDEAGGVVLNQVERFDMWIYTGRYERRRVYVRSERGLTPMVEALGRIRDRLNDR